MKEFKNYIDHFVNLQPTAWKSFSDLFSKKQLAKGIYFSEAGRVEEKIGFLTDGVMRAFYRNANGTEFNKAFFEPCQFVGGYTSLINQETNFIHFQTLTNCTVWAADYNAIKNLFDLHPMIERLARRVAETLFTHKDRREVELVLMDAAQRYEIFKREHPGLENKIAQYHVASYLGVTPTQLSRIRSKK